MNHGADVTDSAATQRNFTSICDQLRECTRDYGFKKKYKFIDLLKVLYRWPKNTDSEMKLLNKIIASLPSDTKLDRDSYISVIQQDSDE